MIYFTIGRENILKTEEQRAFGNFSITRGKEREREVRKCLECVATLKKICNLHTFEVYYCVLSNVIYAAVLYDYTAKVLKYLILMCILALISVSDLSLSISSACRCSGDHRWCLCCAAVLPWPLLYFCS